MIEYNMGELTVQYMNSRRHENKFKIWKSAKLIHVIPILQHFYFLRGIFELLIIIFKKIFFFLAT